ncbi:hypothetical protein Q7P36_002004 [Cladosporium allicinum]
MASAVRALKAATSRKSEPETTPEAEKYRLVVTAGPSYAKSSHKVVAVNTGEAVTFENEFVRARVKVRIRGFRGLPSRCPSSSPYFDDPSHAKDQYSVAFSFVPKQDLPSLNTVWGNDFDHPVRDRLPPGFNTAFKIVKEFIDPGLSCDAYADEPWLYGPSLSCWFAFRLGEKVGDDEEVPEPGGEDEVTREGSDGSGEEQRTRLGLPENNEKRRKFFLDAKNREEFVFEKGRCYQADFFNPYLDFGNCALKLPGFSLNVIKYVDEKSHCLRYVFKNRETGDVYLNVNIALLWDQDLMDALQAEKESDAALQATMGGEVSKPVENDSIQAQEVVAPKDSSERESANQGSNDVAREVNLGRQHSDEGPNDVASVSWHLNEVDLNKNTTDESAVNPTARSKFSLTQLPELQNEANANNSETTPQNVASTESHPNAIHQLLQNTATNDMTGREAGIF